LEPGQDVSCTYTNDKRGSLTITKDTRPNDPQDFSYIGTGPGVDATFTLDDDGTNTGTGGDIKNTVTFSGLEAGKNYSVTEGGATGFDLHDLTCTGLAGTDSGDNTTAGKVTIDSLEPGQDVSCTHTNDKRGSLTITKDTRPNDPQDFSYIGTGPGVDATFTLDDDGTNTGTGGDIKTSVTFSGLEAGKNYAVTEGGASFPTRRSSDLTGLAGTDSGDNTTAGKVTIDSLEPG